MSVRMFVQVQACTCAGTPSGNAPHAYTSRLRFTLTPIRSEVRSTVISAETRPALWVTLGLFFFKEMRFVDCSCIHGLYGCRCNEPLVHPYRKTSSYASVRYLLRMVRFKKDVISQYLTHKSKCVIYLTVGDRCRVFPLHRMYECVDTAVVIWYWTSTYTGFHQPRWALLGNA